MTARIVIGEPAVNPFSVRVLDLDGSVTIPDAQVQVIPMRHFGPRLRYLCTSAAQRDFEAALPTTPTDLTFLGSGDFHHLSYSLIKAHTEPFSLIVFDQHPDWDVTSPVPCCGSWVNEALELSQVKRVIVIGAGAEDLAKWHLLRGNTRALRTGRLEVYPYALTQSNFWGAARKLPSIQIRKKQALSQVYWKTVVHNSIDTILQDVLKRLPTSKVYVSVDKDVLASEWAMSNWDAGQMSLPELLYGIELISTSKTLIGADVTGEWSLGAPANPVFALVSHFDHPAAPNLTSAQLARNAATNQALYISFRSAFMSSDKMVLEQR